MVASTDVSAVAAFLNFDLADAGFTVKDVENVVVLQTADKKQVKGFATILTHLGKKSNHSNLLGGSLKDEAIIRQWLEYATCQLRPQEVHVDKEKKMKELNDALADRTYFAGTFISLADVAVYHALYGLMKNLTCQEKEQYIHFSRWFNNIQHVQGVRQNKSLLPFSRTLLYC